MIQIILDDLEPNLVEKLKYQAQKHGRTLQSELKLILAKAVAEIPQDLKQEKLIPLETLAQEVKESLDNTGYDSSDKIIQLIQNVKAEIADEHLLKAHKPNDL